MSPLLLLLPRGYNTVKYLLARRNWQATRHGLLSLHFFDRMDADTGYKILHQVIKTLPRNDVIPWQGHIIRYVYNAAGGQQFDLFYSFAAIR